MMWWMWLVGVLVWFVISFIISILFGRMAAMNNGLDKKHP